MLCTFHCAQGMAPEESSGTVVQSPNRVTDVAQLLNLTRHSTIFDAAGNIVVGQNQAHSRDEFHETRYRLTADALVAADNYTDDPEIVARLSQAYIHVFHPEKPHPNLYSATNELIVAPNMLSIESKDRYRTRPYWDLHNRLAEHSQFAFCDITGHSIVAYHNPAENKADIVPINIVDMCCGRHIICNYQGNSSILHLTFSPADSSGTRDLAILFYNEKRIEILRSRYFYNADKKLEIQSYPRCITQLTYCASSAYLPLAPRIGYSPDGSHLCIVQCFLSKVLHESFVITVHNSQTSMLVCNPCKFEQPPRPTPLFTTASLSPDARQLLIDGLLIDLTQQHSDNAQ